MLILVKVAIFKDTKNKYDWSMSTHRRLLTREHRDPLISFQEKKIAPNITPVMQLCAIITWTIKDLLMDVSVKEDTDTTKNSTKSCMVRKLIQDATSYFMNGQNFLYFSLWSWHEDIHFSNAMLKWNWKATIRLLKRKIEQETRIKQSSKSKGSSKRT